MYGGSVGTARNGLVRGPAADGFCTAPKSDSDLTCASTTGSQLAQPNDLSSGPGATRHRQTSKAEAPRSFFEAMNNRDCFITRDISRLHQSLDSLIDGPFATIVVVSVVAFRFRLRVNSFRLIHLRDDVSVALGDALLQCLVIRLETPD